MKIFLSKALFFFILFPCIYSFGITLPHQGRVSVSGTPFDGNASFQFALVDQSGNIVWNQESGTITTNPTSVLTLEVINGFYKCNLGDTSIIGMAGLSSDLFDINNQLSLRIWFDDGINGLQQLGTDQPLHVAPYAINSSRNPYELVSAQLGESISSQASASGITESELINRISLLGSNVSSGGQITTATMDPTLLNDLNRTRETDDIADGNITSEKLSSTLLEYLKPKVISSPNLSTHSGDVVYAGQTLNLMVEADGRNLSYQWQRNGDEIQGETNATLIISDINPGEHNGEYSVIISNIFGTTSSELLSVEVNEFNSSSQGQSFKVKSASNMELLWVPSGEYMMGSPVDEDNRNSDEAQRSITFSNGFYLGKFEVTQLEYSTVVLDRPSFFVGNNKPVEKVSWDDIVYVFLPLLNEAELKIGNIPEGWEYVLPTEAEWEYACRAGTTTAYSWGDSITTSDANYDQNIGQTTPVGQYSANPWGFFDMHGNLEEWVWDWYEAYDMTELIDPSGASSGSEKVARGGNFNESPQYARSAARWKYSSDEMGTRLGFRLALKKAE